MCSLRPWKEIDLGRTSREIVSGYASLLIRRARWLCAAIVITRIKRKNMQHTRNMDRFMDEGWSNKRVKQTKNMHEAACVWMIVKMYGPSESCVRTRRKLSTGATLKAWLVDMLEQSQGTPWALSTAIRDPSCDNYVMAGLIEPSFEVTVARHWASDMTLIYSGGPIVFWLWILSRLTPKAR